MDLFKRRSTFSLLVAVITLFFGLQAVAQLPNTNQSFTKMAPGNVAKKYPAGTNNTDATKGAEISTVDVDRSQEVDPVLFTVAGKPVHVSEFLYVYNKNSNNESDKFTKQSLEEYLQLYINFRLKVREAQDLGMDTISALNAELETYRKQLSKSYLYDHQVSDKLLREVYDRMKQEVNASHILIKIDEPGLPSDTLKAYKQALQLRSRLMKGEDFATLAKQFSDDKSAQTNGGNIGWFTALQTVYPFETAAFETKIGTISMPVRTQFGYHVLRVNDKREAQGEITVSHIMLKLPANPDEATVKATQERAMRIYNEAKGGQEWESLVERYSEDKTTKLKGGVLPAFGSNRMVESFEKAAFGLDKDGDISEPVQTEYGFHIIKRINKKTLTSFEEMEADLKKRVERDSRSELAKSVLLDTIKKQYKFKEFAKARNDLFKKVGDKLPAGKFTLEGKDKLTATLFTLADKAYTQQDFVNYLEEHNNKKRADAAQKIYNDYYDKFVEESLLAYEETQLNRKYPAFRMLMQEYRDGILLFELTDEKVWSKAIKDTSGLKGFYETVKNKYMWEERARVEFFTITDASQATKVRKYLGKKGTDATLAKFNKDGKNLVKVDKALVLKGDDYRVDKLTWAPGMGENTTKDDGSVTFTRIVELVPSTPKSLSEAKGYIVSDYQEYLEQEWIKALRNKYPVEVKQDVLTSLVK